MLAELLVEPVIACPQEMVVSSSGMLAYDIVGDNEGLKVGERVGDFVGDKVGSDVVGETVGETDGETVGVEEVGEAVIQVSDKVKVPLLI